MLGPRALDVCGMDRVRQTEEIACVLEENGVTASQRQGEPGGPGGQVLERNHQNSAESDLKRGGAANHVWMSAEDVHPQHELGGNELRDELIEGVERVDVPDEEFRPEGIGNGAEGSSREIEIIQRSWFHLTASLTQAEFDCDAAGQRPPSYSVLLEPSEASANTLHIWFREKVLQHAHVFSHAPNSAGQDSGTAGLGYAFGGGASVAEHALPAWNRGIKLLVVPAVWIALAASSALGQARPANVQAAGVPAGSPYVPTMTFDVASVYQNKEADLRAGITMSANFGSLTTHLRLINFSIENILTMAFGVDQWQVVGAPKWPSPTLFVIDAKGDADADARIAALPPDERRMEQDHMLQVLLADRFKLKTHWETKEGNTYSLVVAKGGPKLGAEGSMPPTAAEVRIFHDRPVPPLHQVSYEGKPEWVAHGCSMGNWTGLLTSLLGRPVVDNTGLAGKYDFVFKYKGRTDQDRSADDLDPTPPIDRGLQEELGLKVEPAKGPVKVLVIDHIEKPSEN